MKKTNSCRARTSSVPSSAIFIIYCRQKLGVETVPEYRFHSKRRWRFDYAIPDYRIAVEVEGGIWSQGRHTRPAGFLGDIEKYNTATLLGWRVFRTTPQELLSVTFLDLLKEAIGGGEEDRLRGCGFGRKVTKNSENYPQNSV